MSVISPCPFCGGKTITWFIPAYSYKVIPECEECGATGAPAPVKNRSDRNEANAVAIESWNRRCS